MILKRPSINVDLQSVFNTLTITSIYQEYICFIIRAELLNISESISILMFAFLRIKVYISSSSSPVKAFSANLKISGFLYVLKAHIIL